MATVTKPIALDESLNTTEVTPRNIADVLADELSNIASKIQGSGSSVSWNQLQVTGDKIAEITISGVKTDVMSHSIAVSRIQTTGTHIADITIDGVKTELYAPQGSPSFNALIVVTAETGKTVTATKGGDTYTATEVSTGTYEVSVDSAGTWTISDGTLSDTVSVVSQTTYYVTLSSVPDGKTVTPTDDVSIWLQCGQRSENYTTLDEVLADSTCLSALMADNNAVDYLVRSTTFATDICADSTAMSYIGLNNYCANTLLGDSDWCEAICNSTYFESVLNVKVPTMTGNTTPSGEVSASNYETQYGGRPPYHAFDNNVSATNWATIVNTTSGWIQYMFTSSVCIKAVNIFTDYRVKNFKIQASNDNFVSDTHDIYTGICNNNTSPTNNRFSMYTSDTDYQYWRVQVENIYSGAFNNVSINEIQFYGRADV